MQLCTEVRDWCNSYVPPHQLISVSLYEDAHENEGKGINAVITHCAGADPKDLANNEGIENKVIYSHEVVAYSADEWDKLFEDTVEKINKVGGQEGHMVASTNDSSNDGGCILILTWTGLAENNLREVTREAGCGCSIF